MSPFGGCGSDCDRFFFVCVEKITEKSAYSVVAVCTTAAVSDVAASLCNGVVSCTTSTTAAAVK